jgi:hypothetical protein
MERAPQIALQLFQGGGKRGFKERFFHSKNLTDSHPSFLYCLKLADFSAYFEVLPWLRSDPARRFILFDANIQAWDSFLSHPKALLLLQDSQVLFFSSEEDLSFFIEKHPVAQIACFPDHPIKKRILQASGLAYGIHNNLQYGDQLFRNFLQNTKQLSHSFYGNQLKGAFPKTPAVICGAGPSLQHAIPWLKTLDQKALILAGGSAIAALSHAGVKPHFCLAADPNFEEYLRFKNNFCFEVPLLYSTRVCPLIFQTCNGPFGYLKSGMAGPLETALDEKLGLQGEALDAEGNTITLMALGFAHLLGCDPIILAGVDLAYTEGVRYAPGVEVSCNYPMHSVDDCLVQVRSRKGLQVTSAVRWLSERDDLSNFAKLHPEISFFNTTESGLSIPYIKYRTSFNFKQERNFRFEIHQKIENAKIGDHVQEKVGAFCIELKESLDRMMEHLKIIQGITLGKSKVLAEIDLKEEIGYHLFFRDMDDVDLFEKVERYQSVFL